MKPASIDDIKKELQRQPPKKVLELLLKLGRFKKENKELLSYLLFEASDEAGYVQSIILEIDDLLAEANNAPYSVSKKILRKIPRLINRQIKYMGSKPSAVDLHMHFARQLRGLEGSAKALPEKMFVQQLNKIEKLLPVLEEDLRHDYEKQLAHIKNIQPTKRSWWKR